MRRRRTGRWLRPPQRRGQSSRLKISPKLFRGSLRKINRAPQGMLASSLQNIFLRASRENEAQPQDEEKKRKREAWGRDDTTGCARRRRSRSRHSRYSVTSTLRLPLVGFDGAEEDHGAFRNGGGDPTSEGAHQNAHRRSDASVNIFCVRPKGQGCKRRRRPKWTWPRKWTRHKPRRNSA